MYQTIKPLLFTLPPETAHNFIHHVGSLLQRSPACLQLVEKTFLFQAENLKSSVLGISFQNPVGLAAGFDKNANLIPFLSALGFGFLEVGAVTALPSIGNPKPRLFRLPRDRALINRMGLNNDGVGNVIPRLGPASSVPVGVNVAKTHNPNILGADAVEDFVTSFQVIGRAPKYITLNVSCPNSGDGKTFEDTQALVELLSGVYAFRKQQQTPPPLLVKFSSDIALSLLERNISVCEEFGVDGYVLCNTSVSRKQLFTPLAEIERIENGGLSGEPIFNFALDRVRAAYQLVGKRKPIIGVGGIHDAQSCYQMITSGASLVQLYTALVYYGPGIVKRINQGLSSRLVRDGFSNIQQAVGTKA